MKKGQNPKNLSHIYIRNKKICIVGLICVAKISKLGYMIFNQNVKKRCRKIDSALLIEIQRSNLFIKVIPPFKTVVGPFCF